MWVTETVVVPVCARISLYADEYNAACSAAVSIMRRALVACLPSRPLMTLTVHFLLKEHTVAPSAQERGTSGSLEARLKAGEDWRAQQDARTQLEDKWKAGQEAAFTQWRSENGARTRVEEDWKALHESRMVNVRVGACVVNVTLTDVNRRRPEVLRRDPAQRHISRCSRPQMAYNVVCRQ